MKALCIHFFIGVGLLAGCSLAQESSVPPIYSEVRGELSPTIVFINGNAATLDVWDQVERDTFELGFRTFRSDREGFGKSVIGARPYHISNELEAIETALMKQNISGEKIIVAHSYGGLIAAMLVERDHSITGVVLVDALLPSELTPAYNSSILQEFRPQYDAVRRQAPEIADAIIPVVEAFPKTGEYLADLDWPRGIRVVTIRAEQTNEPEVRTEISNRMHIEFVRKSPEHRELIIAYQSGHQVMSEDPAMVVESIKRLLD